MSANRCEYLSEGLADWLLLESIKFVANLFLNQLSELNSINKGIHAALLFIILTSPPNVTVC